MLGADFARIDIEGGEEELPSLESEPSCEMVVEIHKDQLLQGIRKKWPRRVEYSFEPYSGMHAYIARLIVWPVELLGVDSC